MDYKLIYATRWELGLSIQDDDAWSLFKILPSRLIWEFVQNRMCTRLIVSWENVQEVSDLLYNKGFVFLY